MSVFKMWSIFVLALAAFAPAPALAQLEPGVVQKIYDTVSPALVVVQFRYKGEMIERNLQAAGIVVSDDGVVVTTIAFTPPAVPDEQLREFKIILPGDDETELDAIFLGRDERANLSFFKAKEPRKWTSVKFEDVELRVGEPVVSVGLLGKGAGYKSYAMTGTVGALLRGPIPQVLVSGGGLAAVSSPVFNAKGQAIGFVQAQGDQRIVLDDDEATGLAPTNNPPNTFVPVRDFWFALSDMPTGTPLKLPTLGVAELHGLKKDVAELYNLKGQPAVQFGDVVPNLPAAKAGLKSGDIIIKMNGQPLERGDLPDEAAIILLRKIQRMKVGDQVSFSVLGEKDVPPREVSVTLTERPMTASRAKRFWAEDLGFAARALVFEDTYARKLPETQPGVVIDLIKPSSSAATARLGRGDLITQINATPVKDLDQFKTEYESLRKSKPKEAIVLEVLRGGNTQVIRIEPPQQ